MSWYSFSLNEKLLIYLHAPIQTSIGLLSLLIYAFNIHDFIFISFHFSLHNKIVFLSIETCVITFLIIECLWVHESFILLKGIFNKKFSLHLKLCLKCKMEIYGNIFYYNTFDWLGCSAFIIILAKKNPAHKFSWNRSLYNKIFHSAINYSTEVEFFLNLSLCDTVVQG